MKKGYIQLIVICFLTLGIAIFGSYYYRKNIAIKLDTPVIKGKLSEITYEGFNDYLLEQDDFYLYVEVAKDDNSRVLEEKLFDTLTKYNLENDTIFINISDIKDLKGFYKDFNKKYGNGYKLSNYPALIKFKDKKINNIIERSNKYLTYKDIDNFLKENQDIE